jgi:hypothetical protein
MYLPEFIDSVGRKGGSEERRKKGKVTAVITPHTKTSKLLWERLYVPVRYFLRGTHVLTGKDISKLLQISQ